jgi:hypothetical protein
MTTALNERTLDELRGLFLELHGNTEESRDNIKYVLKNKPFLLPEWLEGDFREKGYTGPNNFDETRAWAQQRQQPQEQIVIEPEDQNQEVLYRIAYTSCLPNGIKTRMLSLK